MFPTVAQKVAKAVFTLKITFPKQPKNILSIWATFVRDFLVNHFQKQPNLVTLATKDTKDAARGDLNLLIHRVTQNRRTVSSFAIP